MKKVGLQLELTDGPRIVNVTLRALVELERRTGRPTNVLLEEGSLENLLFLAHASLVQRRDKGIPTDFDEFLEMVEKVDTARGLAAELPTTPTRAARSAAVSANSS